MSLYKRLHDVQAAPTTGTDKRRDPVLDELRQKIHHHLIDELGPILYDKRLSRGRPPPPRQRAAARGPRAGARAAVGRRQGPADPGRLRRHPRLRPDRPPPQGRGGHRGHGATARTRSTSSAPASSRRPTSTFVDETHLRRIIDKIVSEVGRRIDEATPLCDARLPDGSRVNAVIHPLAIGGPVPHHPEVLQRDAARSTT